MMTFAGIGFAGPWELIAILVLVLIVFGAGKLPKVLGQMGKGVKAFKEGMDTANGALTEVDMDENSHEKVTEAEELS
jgi:sec-independent protein translocase protein TatA